jgi:hypothetical protein
MTAKEKAKELVDKFEDDLLECDTYFLEAAKKRCALIAVDEIIEILRFDLGHDDTARGLCEYWQEVKSKIHLL